MEESERIREVVEAEKAKRLDEPPEVRDHVREQVPCPTPLGVGCSENSLEEMVEVELVELAKQERIKQRGAAEAEEAEVFEDGINNVPCRHLDSTENVVIYSALRVPAQGYKLWPPDVDTLLAQHPWADDVMWKLGPLLEHMPIYWILDMEKELHAAVEEFAGGAVSQHNKSLYA